MKDPIKKTLLIGNLRRPFGFYLSLKHSIYPLRNLFHSNTSVQENENDENENEVLDDANNLYKRSKNLSSDISIIYKNDLIARGLVKYLRKNLGGAKTLRAANQIVYQVSVFLAWFENDYLIDTQEERDKYLSFNLILKYFYIFKFHHKSIAKFLSHLEDIQLCKPMTCYNYLWSHNHALNWLMDEHYSAIAKVQWGKHFSTEPYMSLAKRLTRRYRLADKQRVQEAGDINRLIEERRWPRGGLEELQRTVNSRLPWAENLVRKQ